MRYQYGLDNIEEKKKLGKRILFPLKPRKKELNLKHFAVFDVEAENWKDLLFVGYYDGVRYRVFDDVESFFDFLLKGRKKKIVYAHYLDYDIMFILDYLLRQGKDRFMVSTTLSNSLLIKAEVIDLNKGFRIEFRNSYAILSYPLGKLFKAFLGKEKTPLSDIRKRNYEDCVYLHEIIKRFFAIVGEIGLTTSQIALKYYRRKYQPCNITNNFKLDYIVRRTYYGGRTEIFNFNLDLDRKVHLFDINSMYPYVMMNNPYPIGEMKKVYKHEKESLGVCLVSFSESNKVPMVAERVENRTIFRNGKKLMWITTAEYEKLLEENVPVEFHVGYETSKVEHIFSDFVKELYSRRQKAKEDKNEVLNLTYKLLMNSLYGKFGQKSERKAYFFGESSGYENVKLISDMLGFYSIQQKRRSVFIVPAIASFTTAYARMHLWDYMQKLDFEDLLYCDTDSIYTFSDRLENSKQLGKMKLEGIVKNFILIKPKVYVAQEENGKWKIRAKGIPKETVNLNTFMRYVLGETIECQRGLRKVRTAVRKFEKEGNFLGLKEIKRSLKTVYDKRKIKRDFSTVPFSERLRLSDYSNLNKRAYERYLNEVASILSDIL